MEKYNNYLNEILKDNAEAEHYINAALEQFLIDHNKELLLISLKQVITSKGGVGKIAQATNINRQHLYRMLSAKGNPSFYNIITLLIALGMKIKVESNKAA